MQKNAEVKEFGGFAMEMCDAGYPKNWPILETKTVTKIKKYLKFFINLKILACEPKKSYF